MNTPNIRSFEQVVPMIYAYSHPDYIPHQGWTKIGYTEKQTVEERVRQQHQTSDIIVNAAIGFVGYKIYQRTKNK